MRHAFPAGVFPADEKIINGCSPHIVKLASKLIITDAGAEFEQTSVV